MSEENRTKPCDCWCSLEYCPVNCEEKRKDMKTPDNAKNYFVNYEEV